MIPLSKNNAVGGCSIFQRPERYHRATYSLSAEYLHVNLNHEWRTVAVAVKISS